MTIKKPTMASEKYISSKMISLSIKLIKMMTANVRQGRP
jgi:hypothetical protein